MLWQIPVLLRVLVAHLIYPFVQKTIVSKPSKTTRLLMQFSCCAVISILLMAITQTSLYSPATWQIMGVGFLNGLAAYCSWRAVAISLTKNSVFTFWDDIIGMGLAYFILDENKFLNGWIIFGIALSFMACILFVRHSYQQQKNGKPTDATPLKFFLFVGVYSVVWGVATFLIRYWALNNVPQPQFLFSWYSGASVGALLIWMFYRENTSESTSFSAIPWSERLFIGLAAVIIFVSMWLEYVSLTYAPLIIVQPIFLVSEMVCPALVGLFIFKEYKQFSRQEWGFLAMGLVGSLFIALNF